MSLRRTAMGLREGGAIKRGARSERLDIAIGMISADGFALLLDAVCDVRDEVPAVTVEGNADEKFFRRCSGLKVSRDRVLHGAALTRDNAGERSDKTSLPVPGAV